MSESGHLKRDLSPHRKGCPCKADEPHTLFSLGCLISNVSSICEGSRHGNTAMATLSETDSETHVRVDHGPIS